MGMRYLALLLMVFMAMVGMPAEASVIPGCQMQMSAQMGHPSCCPPDACDCKIEIPRSQDLLIQNANFETKLSALDFQVVPGAQSLMVQKHHLPAEAQESPPENTPLYEKYSDYRI